MASSPVWLDGVDGCDTGAIFSPCRRWRYLLFRRWDRDKGLCAFIGLNPSTADESMDDPTVRRCMRFAKDWGYGSLWMLNAYAFRATDPRVMKAQGANAIGPLNNEYIAQCGANCDLVVAAWGTHCDEVREHEVRAIVHRTRKVCHHLGLTRDGHPRHPLYLRADTLPEPWPPNPLER